MQKTLVVLICLLFAATCAADQPILVVTPSGYWYLVTDSDGTPHLEAVQRVISTTPGDTPTTPVPPDQPKETEVSRKVKGYTQEIADYKLAQAVSIVYRVMADSVESGELTATNVWPVLVTATDIVLDAESAKQEWIPWRTKVSALTTELTAQGNLTSNKQVVSYLRSVELGLNAAVPADFEEITPAYSLTVMGTCFKVILKAKGE